MIEETIFSFLDIAISMGIMGTVVIVMFRYFNAQLEKKDDIIREKDELFKQEVREYVELITKINIFLEKVTHANADIKGVLQDDIAKSTAELKQYIKEKTNELISHIK